MFFKGVLGLIVAGGLSSAAFGQAALETVRMSGDPLEMVTGQISTVDAPDSRTAILRLLGRARNSYGLRSAGSAYDLKIAFTVNSGGQTEYDGAWKMEEVFDPRQGFRWTANAAAGYAITRIAGVGTLYGEETEDHIPLRLHEVRAALFDPIPPAENLVRASIRTSTAAFNGTELTCVLISGPGNAAGSAPGRRWDESEECLDPQTGLLRTHSQVPGRYFAYEYSDAPRLAGHVLPRKVIVTEAGKTVTTISVDSLTELPAADPALFVPSAEMKARGRATALAGSQKISSVSGLSPSTSGATAHVVCVFGVVTPTGQLVEAHSLQPSDPYSQAAVEAARQMTFSRPAPLGAQPQQYFVFVFEKFVPSQ